MEKLKFNSIAEFIPGQSPSSEFYSKSTGIPFLQGNKTFGHLYPTIDTYTKKATKIAKKGSILMSVRAPVGDLNISPFDICIGRGIGSIVSKKYDSIFLYYLLQSRMHTLVKQSSGTTYDSIDKNILNHWELFIPSNNQTEIGKTLWIVDQIIENNNKINEKLDQTIKDLFWHWFINFDFPNVEDKPYKSSNGRMIYDEDLKREIPENWKTIKILDIADWKTNTQPPKSQFKYNFQEGYIRFIQNRDYDSDKNITYIPYKKSMNIATEFDILIDKYGDAGKVRFGIYGVFNVALAKIDVKNIDFQEYVRSYFESKPIYNFLHNSCIASTRASLSEENLKHLLIVVPDNMKIINKFNELAKKCRETILKNIDENKRLTSLKDLLQSLLMNEQIGF